MERRGSKENKFNYESVKRPGPKVERYVIGNVLHFHGNITDTLIFKDMRTQTKVGDFLRECSNTIIAGQEVKCKKSLEKKKNCTVNNFFFFLVVLMILLTSKDQLGIREVFTDQLTIGNSSAKILNLHFSLLSDYLTTNQV